MKVKNLKVSLALQVGTYQGETYFPDTKFDVEFTNPVTIRITSKKDSRSICTTIYNAIQWDEVADQPVERLRRGPGSQQPQPQPVEPAPEPKVEAEAPAPVEAAVEEAPVAAEPPAPKPQAAPAQRRAASAPKTRGVLDDDDLG